MIEQKIVPVSVIIINYKTPELTINAIRALYKSTVIPAQIILVDNCSNDGCVDKVRKFFPSISIIENLNNVGFAKANNKAIREVVNQPFVWLLNSDTETGPKSLEMLYEYIIRYPKLAAVGPQLVYPTRELQSVGGFFPSLSNVFLYLLPLTFFFPKKIRRRFKTLALYPQPIPQEGKELDYVTGAACFLRKAALEQVGVLAEDYFMYFEETDLCFKLKQAGWGVRVVNTDPVMHIYGGSFKTRYDSHRLKLFLESLQIFVKKNYIGFRKWAIISEIKVLGPLSLVLKKLKSIL